MKEYVDKYLLEELLICPICGKEMIRNNIPQKTGDNIIPFPVKLYICPDECIPPVNAHQIESEVVLSIMNSLNEPNFVSSTLTFLESLSEESGFGSDSNEKAMWKEMLSILKDNFDKISKPEQYHWISLFAEKVIPKRDPDTSSLDSISFNFTI